MRVNVSSEQVKAAFAAVSDDPSFEESRALAASGRMPAQMIQAFTLHPEILRGFAGFGTCVYPGGLLERRVKELVILESSCRNACQFCTQSHLALAKLIGVSTDPLRELDESARLPPRERLALEYTRAAMADSNRISDALFDDLRAHFSDPEIVELTFLIGFINMLNLFNNCLQVHYDDDYAALDASATSKSQ
jgi:AhpD family alkylhydroperoxidase